MSWLVALKIGGRLFGDILTVSVELSKEIKLLCRL